MTTMQQPVRPRLVTGDFLRLGLAALAYFFADGALLPALPRYVAGPLRGSDLAVGMAVGAFSASALVLRPWAGRLADRRGRTTLMVIGAAIFALSVAGYGLGQTVPMLVALRLLTGVGEALFFVGAITATSDLAPAERRGEAISLFSLSLYVGLALGPPVGEAVAGRFGYAAVWTVSSAAAVTAMLLALGIKDAPDRGMPGSSENQARLIHPAAVVPGLLLLAAILGMAGFLTFVPLYALDLGLTGAGGLLFCFAAIVVLIRSVGARIPDRLGSVRATKAALGSVAVGMAIMGLWRQPVGLVAGMVVLAVGVALATPAIMMLALDGVPANERGAVLGTTSMSIDLAFGLGPAALGAVAVLTDRAGMFLVAGGVAVLGLALVMRPTARRPETATAKRLRASL